MSADTTWTFFFRREVTTSTLRKLGMTFDEYWSQDGDDYNAHWINVDLPADTDIEEAIQIARENGAPLGSRRSGIFEVQGPRGIWSHVNERRMDFDTPAKRAKVVFKSWEDLEAEELAEETARLVA